MKSRLGKLRKNHWQCFAWTEFRHRTPSGCCNLMWQSFFVILVIILRHGAIMYFSTLIHSEEFRILKIEIFEIMFSSLCFLHFIHWHYLKAQLIWKVIIIFYWSINNVKHITLLFNNKYYPTILETSHHVTAHKKYVFSLTENRFLWNSQ